MVRVELKGASIVSQQDVRVSCLVGESVRSDVYWLTIHDYVLGLLLVYRLHREKTTLPASVPLTKTTARPRPRENRVPRLLQLRGDLIRPTDEQRSLVIVIWALLLLQKVSCFCSFRSVQMIKRTGRNSKVLKKIEKRIVSLNKMFNSNVLREEFYYYLEV